MANRPQVGDLVTCKPFDFPPNWPELKSKEVRP